MGLAPTHALRIPPSRSNDPVRAEAGFAWRHIALDRDPSHHSRVGGRRGHRLALTRQNRPPLGFLLIAPGLALGMWTILVHPDDPTPISSRAHAVAPDLWACAEAVKDMLGSR